MSESIANSVLITINGRDRVGLISAVAGALFDLGANLADVSFAVLDTGCEFACVAHVTAEVTVETIRGELSGLAPLAGADIQISDFRHDSDHAAQAQVTHLIEISGGDRPGLIARLAEVFVQFNANVVRMNSSRVKPGVGEAVYGMRFEISLPAARARACIAAVSNTAGQLHLECHCREVASGT